MKAFCLGVILTISAVPLLAQDSRGSINGTVTDPQAAIIAGAAVTVANTEAGTSTRLTTNTSGYFEAQLLVAGTYSVTVEAPGFKKYVRSGIGLGLGEQLQINVQMEIGATGDSVTVSADAPLLDTSSVSTGRALSHREVLELPVIGNNITMLTRLAPGVQVPGTTQFLVQGQVGGGSGYNIAGNVGGNEFSLDGASTNGTDRRVSYMPSPDVIDEFKIETSNFDASFGHSTGLGISMSTKSGTNRYHGTATWQYFNQRWNALPFFTKQAYYSQIADARAKDDTARAQALLDNPVLPPGHTNTYSGSVSGPVWIPKVVDGRNKLFFFLGFSGLRNGQSARASEVNYTVPTVEMRNGDFSKLLLNATNPSNYQVYDPITTRPDPARATHYIRDPFVGNVIPKSRMVNPMYDFYTKRLPLPNVTLAPTLDQVNNFNAAAMPNNVKYDSWNNRIDYVMNQKSRFFFRWLKTSYLEDAQDFTFSTETGLMAWNEKRPARAAALDWTYVATSSTVLNITADVNDFLVQNQRLGTRKYKPSDVGLPAYMDAKCAGSCVLPRVTWNGMPYWNGDMVLGVAVDGGPIGRQQGIKSNISHIRGSHSFRAGVDFRQQFRSLLQNGGLTSGAFTFNNTYVRKNDDTFTPAAANDLGWAAFYLGIPSSMTVDTNDTYVLANPYTGLFGQDTWRVRRNVTLTLGLRAEYEMGPTERYNRAISYFDPTLKLPISDAAEAAYAKAPLAELPASQFSVRGGTVYTGQNGVSRRLWRNQLMWLPRLSAAWQISPKTVFRAGYGIYFDTLNVQNAAADQSGFSRTTSTNLTNDFGATWLAGNPQNGISPLVDPFPVRANGTRFDVPYKSSLGPMARAGQGFNFVRYDREHPRVQRWRMGVQRELRSNMMVELAYWGQWADRINITRRLDPLPEQYWNKTLVRNDALATDMNRNVTNPFYIGNFSALQSSDPQLYQQLSTLPFFTSTTIAKNRLLRAFPQMNGLQDTANPGGKALTHSLEVNFQRRFSSGFSMNASYSRTFQEGLTIFENEYETEPRIWTPSNSARPHRFTATGIYELPFGRGRAYLNHGVVNHVLGGWQIAATYEFQPGPLIGEWGNNFYYGDIPNFGDDARSDAKTLQQWFRTDVPIEKNSARTPAAFQARVFPRYFDELRADGLNQWNANVSRNFRIHEGMTLQVRGDALNLQNRSQFNGPETNPTSGNFGKITSATSSTNRFYQVQMRLQF